jgi:hypothetical protein
MCTDVWPAAAAETLLNATVGASDAIPFGPVGLGVGVGVGVVEPTGVTEVVGPPLAADEPPPQPAAHAPARTSRADPSHRYLTGSP